MDLADYVASLNVLEEIEFVGLCTGICVISNVFILKAKPGGMVCKFEGWNVNGLAAHTPLNLLQKIFGKNILCIFVIHKDLIFLRRFVILE